MDIWHIGHSSFQLKGKEVSIVTDPYDPEKVGIRFPRISADVVTVSHDHDDHNQVGLVSDVRKVVSGPGEYEMSGVSIIGISTFHDDKKGQERGKNTVYIFEMEGVRLAHLGDLGHKLSEDVVNAIGDLDVLMVPVGGHYTFDAKTAAEVSQLIEPRIIVPMHYNNTHRQSPLSDEKAFVSELGLPVRREKKLSLKAGALSDIQEIVILEMI